MKAAFPGKPQANLHAIDTVVWQGRRIVVYIAPHALIVFGAPTELLQTVYDDGEDAFEAVNVNGISGKIAVCTKRTILIYRPISLGESKPRWSLELTLSPASDERALASLSWGLPNELLCSGIHHTLFRTDRQAREIWTTCLPNPAKIAAFSPKAGFIASTGWCDRLVKIWRREFFGGDKERFDATYLPHPSAVTGLRWHQRPDNNESIPDVLYTTCSDNRVRIWAQINQHGLQALQLWAVLDLRECLPVDYPSTEPLQGSCCVLMIDDWELAALIEEQRLEHEDIAHDLEKTESQQENVRSQINELCVVFDGRGNMSAWGLSRVGCRNRQSADIFNIARLEGNGIKFDPDGTAGRGFLRCIAFEERGTKGTVDVLVHWLDGTIDWWKTPLNRLFEPGSLQNRLQIQSTWTGSPGQIIGLHKSPHETLVVSRTLHNECSLWRAVENTALGQLSLRFSWTPAEKVWNICILKGGKFAAVLGNSSFNVWNLQANPPEIAARHECVLDSIPLLFSEACFVGSNTGDSCIVKIDSAFNLTVWRISPESAGYSVAMQQLASSTINAAQAQMFIKAPLRYTGSKMPKLFYSITETGLVYAWCLSTLRASSDSYQSESPILDTGVAQPSKAKASSAGRIAVVNETSTEISIWDSDAGHLEYLMRLEKYEKVTGLDWSFLNGKDDALLITFPHKAIVVLRTKSVFNCHQASWEEVAAFSVLEMTTNPINNAVFFGNGDVLISCGSQMFSFATSVSLSESIRTALCLRHLPDRQYDATKVASSHRSLLPSFHPHALEQSIHARKLDQASRILLELNEALKFWTEDEDLSSLLGLESIMSCTNLDLEEPGTAENAASLYLFSEETAIALDEKICGSSVPFLTPSLQESLRDLLRNMASVSKLSHSVDVFGLQYLASRQISWREINFAYHSKSEDILVESTCRNFGGKLLWKDARDCGLFMWVSDMNSVLHQFENIARNEYTKTDERNPIDCSLYYIALRKKQVLVGLWRMATWNREQRATLKLLSNNFDDPRWRTAALKNAYALLGLRRFQYAAAFFLLADRLPDAVGVLCTQMQDVQLAIAVARVYEGDGGPVLRKLLEQTVLSVAIAQGNRWLASWAQWMLGNKHFALKALVDPLTTISGVPEASMIENRWYWNDEPCLAHFYAQVRDQTLKDSNQTVALSVQDEWTLVTRSASLYSKSGLDYLALDLLKNWQFKGQPKRLIGAFDRVDKRSPPLEHPDLVVTDHNIIGISEQGGSEFGIKKEHRKVVVDEPSAASILDNFDF